MQPIKYPPSWICLVTLIGFIHIYSFLTGLFIYGVKVMRNVLIIYPHDIKVTYQCNTQEVEGKKYSYDMRCSPEHIFQLLKTIELL